MLLGVLFVLPGCWTGRCAGGFRGLLPPYTDEAEQSITNVRPDAVFSINVDTSEHSPEQLLAASGVTNRSVILEGAQGAIPLAFQAFLASSAHSCASAASISVKPAAPLPPGDYVLALLLDMLPWPAVRDDQRQIWQGHPALVQRYHVQ